MLLTMSASLNNLSETTISADSGTTVSPVKTNYMAVVSEALNILLTALVLYRPNISHELRMLRTIILIAILTIVKGDIKCARIYETYGPVCVCNATYCDGISAPPNLQTNQFQCYTSMRDGEMLSYSVGTFTTEPDNPIILNINSSEKYQTIQGFGGALTDAAVLNIRTLTNQTQHKLFNSYFGSNGSEYTYIRIPIAGTDFSTRPYTYDDTPNDITLEHFSLQEEDTLKIYYLNHIKGMMSDPDSLRIFATSWSAPAWMKNTHNIKWGYLKREYYQLYADYTRKFFDAYKSYGIDIWGMTPGNEPIDGLFPFSSFNAMLWTPCSEAHWSVNYLNKTLYEAGYKDLIYMAMDDQRFELPWYVDVIFQYENANKLFSGTAIHWYADGIAPPALLTNTHNRHPDKFILMTEACTGSLPSERKHKVMLGSWERGEKYALDIIENLSHWVVGWIDWNIALNMKGGPNWANNFVDSPIIINTNKDEFYKQPMYYALLHFSKFLPRDSYRIFSAGDNKDIKSIAFLTPQQEVVVVVINKYNKFNNITIKDKVLNKKLNIDIPPKSFNTIIYSAS